MNITGLDDSPGIDPLVLNLVYDQISLAPFYLSLAPFYLSLAGHHQDRIMDKVVKVLLVTTIVYDK